MAAKGINHLATADGLFFGKGALDRRKTEKMVNEALAGCDDGELFLEYVQSEGLAFDDGKLKSASYDTTQGFVLRSVAGEATGFAHASALDENALKTGDFRHLAVANPKTAPYGAAAMDTLEHLGLAEPLRARLVQGENIAQTHQFVASGNAELGFVALSQVIRKGEPDGGWLVPGNYHRPIRQDAALLERGAGNPAAVALLAFLRGPEAREVIERYGYRVP